MDTQQLQERIVQLQNGDDRERRAASYALGKSNDPMAVRALMSAFNDTDGSVRQNALMGLRAAGTAEATEFLAAHGLAQAEEAELNRPVVPTASTGRRFSNWLIDQFVLVLVAAFAIDPLVTAVFGPQLLQDAIFAFVWSNIELAVYYFVFEWAFQRTPAKFITGTKVIRMDGSKPDAVTILKRSLTRLVPFEPISMYTGKDLGQKGTWWHDRWTRTRVVRM